MLWTTISTHRGSHSASALVLAILRLRWSEGHGTFSGGPDNGPGLLRGYSRYMVSVDTSPVFRLPSHQPGSVLSKIINGCVEICSTIYDCCIIPRCKIECELIAHCMNDRAYLTTGRCESWILKSNPVNHHTHPIQVEET